MERPEQTDEHDNPFVRLVEGNGYYVDKTSLIEDILSRSDRAIILFTRPPGFGKTVNLSMLDAFLNMRYRGNTWFDDLAISGWDRSDHYRNRFPVIRLDMKGTGSDTYEGFMENMKRALHRTFSEHEHVLERIRSDGYRDRLFNGILDGSIDEHWLDCSLKTLCEILEEYHGRKAVVLMDDYDDAVTNMPRNGSRERILRFLLGFLGETMKGNDSLEMAFMTGIMPIENDSIFSGPNNIFENSIFTGWSDDRFGFTEQEMVELLAYHGRPGELNGMRGRYGGYRFGNTDLCSPYGVMDNILNGPEMGPHPRDRGTDMVLRQFIEEVDLFGLPDRLDLMDGRSVRTVLIESVPHNGSDIALYSRMARLGCLRAVPRGERCSVSIANREVHRMIGDTVRECYPDSTGIMETFGKAALDRDAKSMASELLDILSVGDGDDESAKSRYETTVMGTLCGLMPLYRVRSGPWSGYRMVCITLTPRRKGIVPIIIGLMRSRTEKDLDVDVEEVTAQIREMDLQSDMEGETVLVGIAFRERMSKVLTEIIVRRSGRPSFRGVGSGSAMGRGLIPLFQQRLYELVGINILPIDLRFPVYLFQLHL